MFKPELYHRTIGILVKAYLTNTLIYQDCAKCAVGNIIAANCNYQFSDIRNNWIDNSGANKFVTPMPWSVKQIIDEKFLLLALPEIESTGYHWKDLAKIEFAFETAHYRKNIEDGMFAGLMAVCDVLALIHEVEEPVNLESKALFVK